MVTVTANDAVQDLLAGVREDAKIVDASGRILGYFKPLDPEIRRLYDEARQRIDPEEIKQLKASKEPGITTKELLDYLRSLAPEE